ncbi:hypothetical protein Naga_100345g6 [Nannochloropsis gaditana]|uniref:Uncharacterized protein n=1 Tax=Nannochloropsis gaditana TaxID=72520 RepID=W7TH26_9STRA|nr:hypothetical protein Naga_100345g6 [Nannochloropsis gaditana]
MLQVPIHILGSHQACIRIFLFISKTFITPVVCAPTIATIISAVQSFATNASITASTASISPSEIIAPAFARATVGVARYTLIPAQSVSIIRRSRSASAIFPYETLYLLTPVLTAPIAVFASPNTSPRPFPPPRRATSVGKTDVGSAVDVLEMRDKALILSV